jgi:hypothetical protein
LFFLTTIVTSYFDSCIKVKECTVCEVNKRELNYNDINYNFHFVTSLIFALLPLGLGFLKNNRLKNHSV